MGKFIDLSGQVFGRLKVLEAFNKSTVGQWKWRCSCECGNSTIVSGVSLRNGHTKSCGCIRKEHNYRHGLIDSPEYSSWRACLSRCYNPKVQHYDLYGGRGVTVCDRWREPNGRGFMNFIEDMGERREGTTLNRIQGAMVYSKGTCEWADSSLQNYDKRRLSNNTSGVTGVRWDKTNKNWRCTIGVQGKTINLGATRDFKKAMQIRSDAELKYYGFYKTQTEGLTQHEE